MCTDRLSADLRAITSKSSKLVLRVGSTSDNSLDFAQHLLGQIMMKEMKASPFAGGTSGLFFEFRHSVSSKIVLLMFL
jgi:hypothetical protein